MAVINEEANKIRQMQSMKEAELAQKYPNYVDPEPATVFNSTRPDIPENITDIMVLITNKMSNNIYKEKMAVKNHHDHVDVCNFIILANASENKEKL